MRHDWLGIEKTIHQCETVGFLVWYSYKGTKRIGFIYERRGGQLLVNVPRNSYGEEIWVA